MLQRERQESIRKLIQTRKNVKISELSEILKVSEMTIHRDVRSLVEEGMVMKTFGGITLVREEPGNIRNSDDCVLCNCRVHPRLLFKLILQNNRMEDTCCPHCGLIRHFQLGEKVIQGLCYDFFTGRTVSCYDTWFVFDTSIQMGCCKPQILSFAHRDEAEKMVRSFGGKLLNFKEAMEKTNQKIKSDVNNIHGRGYL